MTTDAEKRPRELGLAPGTTPQSVLVVDDPSYDYAKALPQSAWAAAFDGDRSQITLVSVPNEPPAQPGKVLIYNQNNQMEAKYPDGSVVSLPGGTAAVAAEQARAVTAEQQITNNLNAEITRAQAAETNLRRYFNVRASPFNAKGDGSVSDTAAIQAAIDFAYNGGVFRGGVFIPNGDYRITDTNADGTGIIIPDGLRVIGEGYGSRLYSTTAIRIVKYDGLSSGNWHKGVVADFQVDGTGVATCGLHLYSGAYYGGRDIIARNCVDGIVIDGSQNIELLNLQARDCTTNWKVLNGAGSVVLDSCGSWAAKTRHILIDNDISYPGWGQMQANGGVAYDIPTMVVFRGGVWEFASGVAFQEVLKNVNGSMIILEDVVFAIDVVANAMITTGAAATNFHATRCYFWYGNLTKDLAICLGFNTVFTDCTIASAQGDIFNIGNQGRIIRPNVLVAPGKRLAKANNGSTYTAAQQIFVEPLTSGGGSAGRPAKEYLGGNARYEDYDLRRTIRWDPVFEVWQVPTVTTSGAGAPATAPLVVGDHYIDTTNNKVYVAKGTATAADYILVN